MRRALLAIVAVVTLAACDYSMHEGGAVPIGCCNRGDTLNVVMHTWGDPAARCDNFGGRFDGRTCWDVDF